MKKIILTAAMALSVVGLFAQNGGNNNSGGLMNKRGEMYLPEAGDWAIGFDATPILQYAGNLFNAGANNGQNLASFIGTNNTIVAKYFVDNQTAYRAIVRIGFGSNSWTNLTPADLNGSPAPNPAISGSTVNDQLSVANHFIGLGAGIEKRKGKTRLQGYYGAELMFWIAQTNDSTMTYGNSFNATTNPTPTFYNFGTHSYDVYGNSPTAGRILSDGPGGTFGLSILGFIGVEYFIFPKISLGAEYTWGLSFMSTGQGTTKTEVIYTPTGSATQTDASFTTHTGGSSHFGIDTGVNPFFGGSNAGAANLNVIFHF